MTNTTAGQQQQHLGRVVERKTAAHRPGGCIFSGGRAQSHRQLAKALALAQRFQEQVLQQVVGLCSVAGALAQPAAQFGSVLFPGDGQAVHGVQS
jgi:hypothetical protein